MSDDLHAISSEDPATAPVPTPLRHRSVLSRRATRRTALTTAAGLAVAAPLAGLLGRATPGAAAQDATPAAATPTPWMPPIQTEQVALPQPDFHYPGTVGTLQTNSDPPDFPRLVTPPAGAPNVLLILVDDAGFGQFGTFGGAVPTPAADNLAARAAATTASTPPPSARRRGPP